MAVILSCGVGLTWWLYDAGGRFAVFDHRAADRELLQLRGKLNLFAADNSRLRAAQVTIDRHSQIDSAAQQDTERALKVLQDENAQLKEQLAFFRGVSSGDRGGGVNVYRFKVEPGVAGMYRYQLLLVRVGQQEKVFQGRLQLVVTTQDGGKNNVRIFSDDGSAKEKFKVSVKSYQKFEGDFQLPSTSVVKSVEARIFGDGSTQPRITKIVNLS